MVRASLGHTGQKLRAGPVTRVVFSAIVIAAAARILAALNIGDNAMMLHLAAFAWAIAFLGFAGGFAPALLRPRRI
jgi:uncharacterized protein involved in response to NO